MRWTDGSNEARDGGSRRSSGGPASRDIVSSPLSWSSSLLHSHLCSRCTLAPSRGRSAYTSITPLRPTAIRSRSALALATHGRIHCSPPYNPIQFCLPSRDVDAWSRQPGQPGSRSSRAIETRGILSRAVLRPRSTTSNHYPPVLPPAVQHDGRAAVRAVSRSLTPVAVVLILHSGSSSPPRKNVRPSFCSR